MPEDIFWHILVDLNKRRYDGRVGMLGVGRLPPSPPNCYLWGALPLKLPIFYNTVIFGHPKKTRNEKMYIQMVKCCLDLWRWIDSWPKRCLRFGHDYVPSAWYQVLCTKHLAPSTRYQVLGTKYLVPSTWYHVLGVKYLVPSTWYNAKL